MAPAMQAQAQQVHIKKHKSAKKHHTVRHKAKKHKKSH